MTGYGSSTLQVEGTTITVEIRSVNHRFLDIIPKYPRTFLFLEDKMRKIIKTYFSRGRMELHIEVEGETFINRSVVADWALMDQFIEQLHTAQERYKLKGEIPISIVTQIPDLFTVQEQEQKPSEIQERLLACIEDACKQVQDMRIEEGKKLLEDILNRITAIREMILSLEGRREIVVEEYRTRINKRINDFVQDSISLDESRLIQEIALMAEKGDITEEITRLLSHLDYIEEISNHQEPIGRKFDFVLQEMNREANTIGSKSTDHMIGEWTVAIKSEIEKIKEQVQNIE